MLFFIIVSPIVCIVTTIPKTNQGQDAKCDTHTDADTPNAESGPCWVLANDTSSW